jgi:hypothetical protein
MTRAADLIGLVQGFLTCRFHRFSAGFNGAARNVGSFSEASIAFSTCRVKARATLSPPSLTVPPTPAG